MRQPYSRRKIMPAAILLALAIISLLGMLPAASLRVNAQGQTGTPNPRVTTGLWPRAMAYDGKTTLWITDAFDDTVRRLDINTNQQIGTAISVWPAPATGFSQVLPA